MTDDPQSTPGSGDPSETGPALNPPGPDDGGVEEARLRELLNAGADGAHGDPLSAIFAVQRRVHRTRALRSGLAACLVVGLIAALVVIPGGSRRARAPQATPVRVTPAPVYRLTGALVSFNSCSDYLSYLRTQALAVVGPYGLQPGPAGSFGQIVPDLPDSPVNGEAFSASTAAGVPTGAAAGGASTSAAAGDSGSAYSQTNDQVPGVDEPDTVKTDGNIVVTLDGSTLRVLDLEAHVIGSLQLSGDTSGGFVLAGDQAIVFSSTAPAQNEAVGAGGYEGPSEYVRPLGLAPVPATARVAVVDLSDPTHPQLSRTFLFDGTIAAARLVNGQVRLVVETDGPRITFVTPTGTGSTAAATAANRSLVVNSTLGDWLPAWQAENPNGSATARQPIAQCDAVARPAQASGLSTVSVLSLDPASSAPGPGTSVVAAGDTVYATANQLYVAGPTGTAANDPYAGMVQSGCCTVVPPSGASTRIYAFATPSAGPPVFEGVGSVPGWLINSYAMDEDANGLLRVASTAHSSAGSTESQITVLRQSDGHLMQVGALSGLGPGEFIRAVRFFGDQAYVVTYRTFDPLYIVDLSNPDHPVLAGELDQPGFSEFLYPLPDQRLLGVGVQITDNEPSGLVVATYDVSDPAHPRRLDSSVLASGFQYVTQGYDPHAFLYWSPLSLALVAVPSDGPYGAAGGAASEITGYQIGLDGQLTRTATLSHGADLATRSVVIGGQVWAVTSGGVVTADLTDLPASTWHSY